ncbi:hypothetical protein P029_02415 [Anaplasma phagocytophilum str. Norway variant2]|uniref:Uncharacterized protein n=1 Tax=Anaplasma phagocytophilum str. Norway variant2 TaxID=1392507 RepID=A0A168HA83_ANAPH|nr:hypothetical protein P029_02415 [Anaplasma phagocytophilum str. Norway variant2]
MILHDIEHVLEEEKSSIYMGFCLNILLFPISLNEISAVLPRIPISSETETTLDAPGAYACYNTALLQSDH